MDDLHRHLFSLLMDREWKYGVAAAVDVTLLGRYYERFADHAVEIGRRVVFLVTGVLPPETRARRFAHSTHSNGTPSFRTLSAGIWECRAALRAGPGRKHAGMTGVRLAEAAGDVILGGLLRGLEKILSVSSISTRLPGLPCSSRLKKAV